MAVRPDTDELIKFLDEIAMLDPVFMGKLISARQPCNDAILNHPTIQASAAKMWKTAKHSHNRPMGIDEMRDTQGVAGFIGVLNGYCGAYDDGPKKGWGPISVIVEDDGTVSRVFRTPNEDANLPPVS